MSSSLLLGHTLPQLLVTQGWHKPVCGSGSTQGYSAPSSLPPLSQSWVSGMWNPQNDIPGQPRAAIAGDTPSWKCSPHPPPSLQTKWTLLDSPAPPLQLPPQAWRWADRTGSSAADDREGQAGPRNTRPGHGEGQESHQGCQIYLVEYPSPMSSQTLSLKNSTWKKLFGGRASHRFPQNWEFKMSLEMNIMMKLM